MAVLLISHSLDDVFDVADRVQVMRRGQKVGTVRIDETSQQEVLGMIVGTKQEEVVA
jgi:simple sugar transport system ATP-binding protein/D-xylose transport system ATP-binding protein